MPVRKKTSTTRLPQALKDELSEAGTNGNHRTKFHLKPKISRKETRKEERLKRKKHKAEYFSVSAVRKRPAEEEPAGSPTRKKVKYDAPTPSTPPVSPSQTEKVAPPTRSVTSAIKTNKVRTPLEKLTSKRNAPRIPDQKANEEDAYIAYLEAQLGYATGKKNKNSEEDDGLDDLLDFTDSLLHPVLQNGDEIEDEGIYGAFNEGDTQPEGNVVELETNEEEWKGITQVSEDDEEDVAMKQNEPSVKESATRYIPPHLKNREPVNEEPSEAMIKLSKQLKGLLNRMSEQNLASILNSIEAIYRDNRRNDVTTTLTTLIIDAIASHSSLLDSYVVLFAAFVSSLHKLVGIEFAAYFVQTVVSSYENYYAMSQNASQDVEPSADPQGRAIGAGGKECSNIIILLSELYNFQVISCLLVFDVIRGLLDGGLGEFCVELLLKIVRNSGKQLRQDDPSALKDIIQIVQSKVSGTGETLSSRTLFMIEALTNLKNNKLKRNATQNQGAESVERMKKFLAGLSKKRTVLAHEPLRVSLEDLHSASTKGKWWLVGAAWGGDPLVDKQAAVKKAKLVETADPAGDFGKLARKQGMNTDIRRSIFIVLMSSDDYVDACERLSQLSLTETQQREIVRVLLHCCGNEKSYNPYYTLVCQQLCRTSHSYKITLQFCLWDFFRDLGETSVGGAEVIKHLRDDGFDITSVSTTRMYNVAKAYGWWISKGCVTLAILKPVDFTSLKSMTKEFLREMLTQVFICSQRATPMITSNSQNVPTTQNRGAVEEIFVKATRIETLAMGLVYFISEEFPNVSKDEGDMAKLIKWASGLAKETLRTGVDIVPTL